MMKSVGISLLVAGMAAAHFGWIAPVNPVLQIGVATPVKLGVGHELGISESAPPMAGLESYALAPSGARTPLRLATKGPWVVTEYTAKEAGQHRLVLTHDRGIRSRTPKGIVEGGRDKNPTATEAFRSVRTGVAYAATAGAKFAPQAAGLVYELLPERTEKGLTVTLLLRGRPCAGGNVTVSWEGKKEVTVGTTGADGKTSYVAPAGAKGPVVVLAGQAMAAAKGAGYDKDNHQTALYLNW
jgi:uncharacterized GH25 family protein